MLVLLRQGKHSWGRGEWLPEGRSILDAKDMQSQFLP